MLSPGACPDDRRQGSQVTEAGTRVLCLPSPLPSGGWATARSGRPNPGRAGVTFATAT